MAKKGGHVQLQVEVENDEEWEKLVDRPGLILVDVYCDWCGPCTGMSGNLRKAKLEYGGDTLTLATAKCDNITVLSRFRNHSRPTWMFISNHKVIRLIFGTNAPKLMSILINEIQQTKKAMAEKEPREGIEFDELTEEEQLIVDEENRIQEEAEIAEREATELAIMERRDEVAENLLEPLRDFNFIMVWPHVGNDGMAQIFNSVKQETLLTVAGRPVKHRLTEEEWSEMLYYGTWEYDEIETEQLLKDDVTGLLFQLPMGDEETDPIEIFRRLFFGAMECPPGEEDSMAIKLSNWIKIEKEIDNEEDEAAKEEQRFEMLRQSVKRTSVDANAVADEEEKVRIPAIYVPENEKCKVLGMRFLFPIVTLKHDLPEPEPIPPRIIVAFDVFKRNEVLQLASEFPETTMNLGFFTSSDAAEAQLIAKTEEQFERLHAPMDAKLVVQVSKKKSEPLLSYCALGPIYISANAVIGDKESSIFFPEGYDEPEEEPEPEVQPKKKKKKKGSKGSSSTSSVGESQKEQEEEGEEEKEDDIEEEDGDDEEEQEQDGTGTSQSSDFDPLAGYVPPEEEITGPATEEADKATTTE